MVKKIAVELPIHLKKFFMFEYDGYARKNGVDEIHINKHSELGKLMHLISRPIPFTQREKKPVGTGVLHIRYYSHVQAMEIDLQKIPSLIQYMDEIFRRTLICEVRGGHELSGSDYGPLITAFLKRRGIERDIDIDYQTVRKVYRDYVAKINRKMAKSFA